MSTIRVEAVIRSTNESLLLDAALKQAARRGLAPGSYLEVRRTAQNPTAFDVETIIEAALGEAACGLVSLQATVTPFKHAGDTVAVGDIMLIDRRDR